MEQVVQLASQYWTASSRAHLQQSYLRPEQMQEAGQLADQYLTANSRVPLQQSYLCPEPMEQAVQLPGHYWTAHSRGDRGGFRGFELMPAGGPRQWPGRRAAPC